MAFLPRNERFFELFKKQSSLLRDAVTALAASTTSGAPNFKELSQKLADIETRGDGVTLETIETLAKTFITPLDSEDIYALAVAQDDALDTLSRNVARWEAMGLETLPAGAPEMVSLVAKMATSNAAVFDVMVRNEIPKATLDELHGAKDAVVTAAREALRSLFAGTADPLAVVRAKDVYDGLESFALKMNQIAHVVQGVVLKNA